MKTVMIAELKNRLSLYLRRAQGGEEILVTDRKTPIARLMPLRPEREKLGILPATRPVSDLKKLKFITPKKPFDPLEALLEERGDH